MHIAICDDDKSAREQLEKTIYKWAFDRNVEVGLMHYDNAEMFTMSWPEFPCDLVFLDIKMKKMNGVQLAAEIRKIDRNILIVFVTGFKQYSLEGYHVEALNYLMKPLSQTKLLATLDKAYMIYYSRRDSFLIVSKGENQYKVFLDDIYGISMSAHYAEIFTADASYTMRKSAKELTELLPEYFVRCHRSHIINIFKVDCICGGTLILSNKKKLPISRSNAKQVKDAFITFHAR